MEERLDTIYLTETTAIPSYIAYPIFYDYGAFKNSSQK